MRIEIKNKALSAEEEIKRIIGCKYYLVMNSILFLFFCRKINVLP